MYDGNRFAEGASPIDPINPSHYAWLSPQPIEVIERWGMSYHAASALKYISRYKNKGGPDDIRKAIWFLERLLQFEYGIASKEGGSSSNS